MVGLTVDQVIGILSLGSSPPKNLKSVHFIFLNISIESARTLLTHIGHRHTLLLALVVLT